MAVVGAIAALGTYYLGKLSLDPFLIGTIIGFVVILESLATKWIKYNFQMPDEEEPLSPENNVKLAVNVLTENLPKIDPNKLPLDTK